MSKQVISPRWGGGEAYKPHGNYFDHVSRTDLKGLTCYFYDVTTKAFVKTTQKCLREIVNSIWPDKQIVCQIEKGEAIAFGIIKGKKIGYKGKKIGY